MDMIEDSKGVKVSIIACQDYQPVARDMYCKNLVEQPKLKEGPMDVNQQKHLQTEEDLCSQDLLELPPDVLKHNNIVNLLIDYNMIKELPKIFSHSLPNLKCFSAIGNNMEYLPDTFGCLSQLSHLYLNENRIVNLPESFCNLKSLVKLNLNGNKLETLPENFGEITSLKYFECDENRLVRLPKTFGLLENMEVLELQGNSIENVLEGFGMLKALKFLNISNNKLTMLPESFGCLPNLVNLDLSGNNLKCLPSECKSCRTLQKVYIDNNNLQFLPDWISDLEDIVEFSLICNRLHHQCLTDRFPQVCIKLKQLDMCGNFMSKLPNTFGELTSLEFLHLGSVKDKNERMNVQNGNCIVELPDSFCCMRSLRELYLDENQLNDLPAGFGELISLETLDLGHNFLHCLPDSFGKLVNLRICVLSKNHIQWLPSNFGKLASLENLRLDDNELCELPESFCKLIGLQTLNLFSNRLVEIPSALHSLKNLVRLDLDANDFHIPFSDIPQIMTKAKYPNRNSEPRDNWQGRPTQDLTNLADQIITLDSVADLSPEEFEPPPSDLPYNEDFLRQALKSNLSIWQSHGSMSNEYHTSWKNVKQHYQSWSDETSGDPENDDDCDNNNDLGSNHNNINDSIDYNEDDDFEPPVFVNQTKWSGSKIPIKETHNNCLALLESTECWDDDVDEPYGNVSAYKYPSSTLFYRPIDNDFKFTPFDIHMPKYVKRPEVYHLEEQQFDNCDGDDTDYVSVDPIF